MVSTERKNKILGGVKAYLLLLLAGIVMAIGVHTFILPCRTVAGGVAGLSNILFYAFKLPVGIGSILLNAPLLLAALIKLKKSYSIRTVFACVVYSVFITLLDKIGFPTFDDSRIIGVVMGGTVSAVAITLAYFAGGSNGGSEIVTGLVSIKKPDVEMGKVLLLFNMFVYALAFIFERELMIVLYSLLMSYVSSFCVKIFMHGIDPVLQYTVITRKPDELNAELSKLLKRGITNVNIVDNNFDSTGQKMLVVVIQFRQNQAFRNILRKVDSECFAYCTAISSVVNNPNFNKRYK